MKIFDYSLYDIVELKKPHPCQKRSKLFQIVMLGVDVKIRCLGCGNYLLLSRDSFNKSFKKVVEHKDSIIDL